MLYIINIAIITIRNSAAHTVLMSAQTTCMKKERHFDLEVRLEDGSLGLSCRRGFGALCCTIKPKGLKTFKFKHLQTKSNTCFCAI